MSSWQCTDCELNNSNTSTECQACFKTNPLPPFKLEHKLPNSELLDLIIKTSMIAKQSGYLISFESKEKLIQHKDINFMAKLATNLSKKPKPELQTKNEKVFKDPFMPPFDIGAVVCDLNDEYRLLLNKYNVVDNHVLIITSKFISQNLPLTHKINPPTPH